MRWKPFGSTWMRNRRMNSCGGSVMVFQRPDDRAHDLHLAKAHMASVGAPPRRPVVAEDIRDLQHWTGHDRRPLRRRLDRLVCRSALLGLLLAWLRQSVERALDIGDHAGGDARVTRRRI